MFVTVLFVLYFIKSAKRLRICQKLTDFCCDFDVHVFCCNKQDVSYEAFVVFIYDT